MPRKLLFLLLLLTACTDGEQMRRDLATLQTRNEADSLLTDSGQALTLTDYFDRHGTDNERLLAHYLLARTWTDLGQSPRALEEYHNAAGQADTTRLDSLGHHWLSRIYGQMGGLFLYHELPYNALNAFDNAYKHASQAKESSISVNFYSQKASCYYALDIPDSAVVIEENAVRKLLELGDTLMANTCLGPLAFCYIERNDLTKAKHCLNLYEHHSLLSDSLIQYFENWKLLYYYKGYYYQHAGQIDSALYYYNKEIQVSENANNRSLAYKGLYQVYKMLGLSDSVAKYAMLHDEITEKTYKRSTSAALLSIHHLYDYDRIQAVADKKTIEAETANRHFMILVFSTLLFIVFATSIIIFINGRKKIMRQRMNHKYVTDILNYKITLDTLHNLEVKNTINEHLFRQAKNDLSSFRESIMAVKKKHPEIEEWNLQENLEHTPFVTRFKKNGDMGKKADDHEWQELRNAVRTYLPGFIEALNAQGYPLSFRDINICILIKLNFTTYQIRSLIGMSSSSLSTHRSRLLERMFNQKGSAVEFDNRIKELNHEEYM